MQLTSTIYLKRAMIAAAVFLLAFYTNAQDFETDGFGVAVMEAEDYSDLLNVSPASSWESDTTPSGYSANGAMIAAPPEGDPFASAEEAENGSAYLSYSIDFGDAGIYYVWARANRTGGGDDSYHFGLNGTIPETGTFINFENPVGLDSELSDSAQWVWINTSGEAGGPAFVDVPSAGEHTLDIFVRETGFRIDLIVLSPDQDFEPSDDEFVSEPTTSIHSVRNNADLGLNSYPNPFTDQTTIAYNLPSASHVNIKIYSIDGSEVATVFNGYKSAGQSEFTWAPESNLPSGIYFVQLKTDNHTQSIKTVKVD